MELRRTKSANLSRCTGSLKYLVVLVAGLMFHGLLVCEDCLLVCFCFALLIFTLPHPIPVVYQNKQGLSVLVRLQTA